MFFFFYTYRISRSKDFFPKQMIKFSVKIIILIKKTWQQWWQQQQLLPAHKIHFLNFAHINLVDCTLSVDSFGKLFSFIHLFWLSLTLSTFNAHNWINCYIEFCMPRGILELDLLFKMTQNWKSDRN